MPLLAVALLLAVQLPLDEAPPPPVYALYPEVFEATSVVWIDYVSFIHVWPDDWLPADLIKAEYQLDLDRE